MSKRVMWYGERMTIPRTFVRDEITEQPKRREPAQPKKRDPKLEAKLARVVELLEKLVAEDRPAVTDVMAAKKQQRHENARRLRGAEKFESSEDRVTVPAKYFEDAIRQAVFEAACEGSQAAYAARNPHKAQKDAPQENRVQYPHQPRQRERWEERLETADSASRFLIACEQSQSAYAARNPHKRGK